MTAQQLVALGIRLAALFIIIVEIRTLSWWVFVILENKDRFPEGMDLIFLIGSMSVMILCVVCAVFPMPVARILIPTVNKEHQVSPYAFQDFETLGLLLLGLWILADGIPDAVHHSFLYSHTSSGTWAYFSATNIADIASCAAQILIGFGLILGRRGVRGVWRKFRDAGWEHDSPT